MLLRVISLLLCFDMSLLLLTVTLRGYLISIAYCLFFHFLCFDVTIFDLVHDVEAEHGH